MSQRDPVLYLIAMVEEGRAASRFLRDRQRAGAIDDDILMSAVLLKLIRIGEAAARLPDDIAGAIPAVPWQRVAAFRHFAVHRYFDVSHERAYDIATNDVPPRTEAVLAWLRAERPLVARELEDWEDQVSQHRDPPA